MGLNELLNHEESVERYYNKSAAPLPEFTHGAGIRLFTEDGEEYLDCASGTFNVPLGYANEKVTQAVINQIKRLPHVSSTYTKRSENELIRMLVSIAPSNIRHARVRDITGSTANECALKIVSKKTGKKGVVSFSESHHGQTLKTSALSEKRYPYPVEPNSDNHILPAPNCYRCPYKQKKGACQYQCIQHVEQVLNAFGDEIGCMIVEPILGHGGNIVPPLGYFEAVQRLCKQSGVLIIADEVQTSFGRAGYMFASPSLGLMPDIITVSKGLGGIGIPVAAVLYTPECDVLEHHEHSFTAGGNLVALAAAKATIEEFQQTGVLENVRRNSPYIHKGLESLKSDFSCIGEVRGRGYMWGLEIIKPDSEPAPDLANEILDTALTNYNLILRSSFYGYGNTIKFRPALVANRAELKEMISRLGDSIREAIATPHWSE